PTAAGGSRNRPDSRRSAAPGAPEDTGEGHHALRPGGEGRRGRFRLAGRRVPGPPGPGRAAADGDRVLGKRSAALSRRDTPCVRLEEPGYDFYVPRVRWDEDGTLLVQIESRDQKSLKLLRADAVTGSATVLLEDRSDTWIDLHDDLRPLRDGRFLWSSEAAGFRHLELRAHDGAL